MPGSHYAIPCEHAALAALSRSIDTLLDTTTNPTHVLLLLQISSTLAKDHGIKEQNRFFTDALTALEAASLKPVVIAYTIGAGPPDYPWEYPAGAKNTVEFGAVPQASRSVLLRLQLSAQRDNASVALPYCGSTTSHAVSLEDLFTKGTTWC